ncbi:MAG: class I SAM-dependent methyltransferase [Actinomycetota bacterium]
MATATIDEAKVEALVGAIVSDAGGAITALLVYLGDKLGFYKALADGNPVTAQQLATKTKTHPRLVREWLSNQAAAGYVTYDGDAETFSLSPEQAFALADESSPALLNGFFQVIAAAFQSTDKEIEAFRTGRGLAWGDHHHELFDGTRRFFKAGYTGNLVSSWIPALDGVEEKLQAGAKVADVGCGLGASTIILAQAYRRSTFVGFDYHGPSIDAARKAAAEAGVADRVTFEVASSYDFPGSAYDFIAFFDCWHDMGDPIKAATHAREALAPGGSIMLVEPFANDALKDNLNLVGKVFYGASTVICTPCSLDEGGLALGAQAGPARTTSLLNEAGLSHTRVATQTPFNIVYEARA